MYFPPSREILVPILSFSGNFNDDRFEGVIGRDSRGTLVCDLSINGRELDATIVIEGVGVYVCGVIDKALSHIQSTYIYNRTLLISTAGEIAYYYDYFGQPLAQPKHTLSKPVVRLALFGEGP
jgi:hypothetical protein